MKYEEQITKRGLDDIDNKLPLDAAFRIAQRMGYADFYCVKEKVKTFHDLGEQQELFFTKNKIERTEYIVDRMKFTMMWCGFMMAAQDWFAEQDHCDRTVKVIDTFADELMEQGLVDYAMLKQIAFKQYDGKVFLA